MRHPFLFHCLKEKFDPLGEVLEEMWQLYRLPSSPVRERHM